jgi:hypothetical protein
MKGQGAAITRILTLRLGEFSQRALAGHARLREETASSALRSAVRHYLAERDAQRTAWRMPRFRRLHHTPPGCRVDLPLDEKAWEALEAEAERQGVTASELGEHALLYFLADLDR